MWSRYRPHVFDTTFRFRLRYVSAKPPTGAPDRSAPPHRNSNVRLQQSRSRDSAHRGCRSAATRHPVPVTSTARTSSARCSNTAMLTRSSLASITLSLPPSNAITNSRPWGCRSMRATITRVGPRMRHSTPTMRGSGGRGPSSSAMPGSAIFLCIIGHAKDSRGHEVMVDFAR
jgi:hypothetical protein